jgi:2-polyprenyl-3-methyl-5-hydroxy-6-metoxy-1,4-benzoquinol methylase
MKNRNFASSTNKNSQHGNKDWWNSNPMTYDWEGDREVKEGTLDWYKQIDEEFWDISKTFAHQKYPNALPFSDLIDYASLSGKKVLEIGCGAGSIAQVLAEAGADLTAIDLTDKAIQLTKKRFDLLDISATIKLNDAEALDFPDNSFDFIWSWGVIHHSANTSQIVKEIHRVLKPNGKASIMVYHRNSTRYIVYGGLSKGILSGYFLRYRSLYEVNMTFTDGFIARHYTRKSAAKLFSIFSSVSTRVMDGEVPAMFRGWDMLTRILPIVMKPINRWIVNRYGWFLFIDIMK